MDGNPVKIGHAYWNRELCMHRILCLITSVPGQFKYNFNSNRCDRVIEEHGVRR